MLMTTAAVLAASLSPFSVALDIFAIRMCIDVWNQIFRVSSYYIILRSRPCQISCDSFSLMPARAINLLLLYIMLLLFYLCYKNRQKSKHFCFSQNWFAFAICIFFFVVFSLSLFIFLEFGTIQFVFALFPLFTDPISHVHTRRYWLSRAVSALVKISWNIICKPFNSILLLLFCWIIFRCVCELHNVCSAHVHKYIWNR